MDEITLTHAGRAEKSKTSFFCYFWQLKNSSHTQTFKHMSRAQFCSMLVKMSSVRINNNVGPTHARGGTLDLLMTDVPDLVRVAVVAPIGNSDHSNHRTLLSVRWLRQFQTCV